MTTKNICEKTTWPKSDYFRIEINNLLKPFIKKITSPKSDYFRIEIGIRCTGSDTRRTGQNQTILGLKSPPILISL